MSRSCVPHAFHWVSHTLRSFHLQEDLILHSSKFQRISPTNLHDCHQRHHRNYRDFCICSNHPHDLMTKNIPIRSNTTTTTTPTTKTKTIIKLATNPTNIGIPRKKTVDFALKRLDRFLQASSRGRSDLESIHNQPHSSSALSTRSDLESPRIINALPTRRERLCFLKLGVIRKSTRSRLSSSPDEIEATARFGRGGSHPRHARRIIHENHHREEDSDTADEADDAEKELQGQAKYKDKDKDKEITFMDRTSPITLQTFDPSRKNKVITSLFQLEAFELGYDRKRHQRSNLRHIRPPMECVYMVCIKTTIAKIGKKAVHRVMARRRINHAARLLFPKHAQRGWEYIFDCFPQVVLASHDQVMTEIRYALKKGGWWKDVLNHREMMRPFYGKLARFHGNIDIIPDKS